MLVSVVRRIRQILRSMREGTSLGKGEGATEVI
jgi:hypothetical protein